MNESVSNTQIARATAPSGAAPDLTVELGTANRAGTWMVWAGLGFAVLWWAGATAGLLGLVGPANLSQQPLMLIIATSIMVVLPGLLILMSGFMARQSKRANAANILLLRAADQLLAPARHAANEVSSLGEATRSATMSINETTTEALVAMRTMSETLSNERLRAESVSYAMADNARDLTRRLADERQALETLSKALDQQSQVMGEAIPRQANAMVAAAREASEEVGRADAALEARLETLKQAGSTLAVRLIDLDAVARDAASRTEAFNASISRIEEKLGQSKKTVEMAERASDMAVEAAATTGNALRDAVSAALDGAREANQEIADTTRQMRENATATMAELRSASTAAITQSAKARQDADRYAMRARRNSGAPATSAPTQHSNAMPPPAPQSAEPVLKPNGRRPLFEAETVPVAPQEPPSPPPVSPDADLFGSDDDAPAANQADTSPTLELGSENSPILLNQQFDNKTAAEAPPEIVRNETEAHAAPPAQADTRANGPRNGSQAHNGSQEWRDIIADMGEEPSAPPHPDAPPREPRREAMAEELMTRLQSSGIPLPTALRSRDKRKIAAAARKNDRTRRLATRSAAGNEVDRVAVRLKKDENLMGLARNFVSAEEDEALKALADTSRTGRHATARLSAYLLVDAALEATTH